MQDVKLKVSRVIRGAVRYPVEGLIPVDDDEYDRLVEADAIELDDDEDGEDDDGLEAMKLADLKKLADDDSDKVDLGTATRKADIVSAIRKHRLAKATTVTA